MQKKRIIQFLGLLILTLFFFKYLETITTAERFERPNIPFTPKNTEIHFDIDDTIVTKSYAKLWFDFIKEVDFKLHLLWPLIFDADAISQCAVGHPWNLFYQAIKKPELRPYVIPLLKIISQAHKPIPFAFEIIKRLKEKGYRIVYATNKDHISYEYTAEFLKEPFTSLPDKVIAYYPQQDHPIMQFFKSYVSEKKNGIDLDFQTFIKKVYETSETNKIIHASLLKPAPQYTNIQRKTSQDRYIIFFDDLKKNIDGVNCDGKAVGIQVFNRSSFSIVTPLIDLGILNKADPKDNALINGIYNAEFGGVFGSIRKKYYDIKSMFIEAKKVVIEPSRVCMP